MAVSQADPAVTHLSAGSRPESIDRVDDRRFSLHVVSWDDPIADLAMEVERTVFLETFGNTAELLATEYDPYQRSSMFLVVLDERRQVAAGMIRIIVPSDIGLKSVNDVELLWDIGYAEACRRSGVPFAPDQTWDVATLAVSPDYRGELTLGVVSSALYQALSMAALRCGFRYHVAVMDVAVHRMVKWWFSQPFRTLDGLESRDYLGSKKSLPVWGDAVWWRQRVLQTKPELYRVMCLGEGIDSVRAPDWDAVGSTIMNSLGTARQAAALVG
jgi:hypothetical protein